jgi:non-specific serine/threonine protein kinase
MSDLIGRTLGHYRITAKIGEGGMGEVYLARDERLDREVAIKVLPEGVAQDAGRLARFETEAKAVAKLTHPNILDIHELGEHEGRLFIVTELLEGETLRERLEAGVPGWRKAAEIGAAIADGLGAAHEVGIVHRDLKPSNVFLTADGRVKVLDFGLARFEDAGAGRDVTQAPTITRHTDPGTVLGTVGYMSPEQVRGETVDQRSDIFSLGCVLYEMVSGQRAFSGDSAVETMNAILTEEPSDVSTSGVDLPPELAGTTRRCLEKRPQARFQSASDLAYNLRTISSASVPPVQARSMISKRWPHILAVVIAAAIALLFIFPPEGLFERLAEQPAEEQLPRIVVLPFENLGSPEDEYFADGITDEVRGKLFRLAGLEVIARYSSDQYRGTTKPLSQIAEELGARFLLTAKVRWQKSDDETSRVRVSPELVEVQPGAAPVAVWHDAFDATLADVFQVQANIATRVANALDVKLSADDQHALERRPTENLAAYDAFLQAEQLIREGVGSGVRLGLRMAELYRRAVALDPEFALAWTRLSQAETFLYIWGDPNSIRVESAREAAERALEIDPMLPEARLAMASYLRDVENDRERADEQIALGLEAAPNHPVLRRERAARAWRREDWLAFLEREAALDPLSWNAAWQVGIHQLDSRRYRESEEWLDRAYSLAPTNLECILDRTMLFLAQGDLEGARRFVRAAEVRVDLTELVAHLASYYELFWVLDDEWQQLLFRLGPEPFFEREDEWGRSLAFANAHHLRGEWEQMRANAEIARANLTQLLAELPDDDQLHSYLGSALAYLGREDEALAHGRRGLELARARDTPWDGHYLQLQLVRSHIILGQAEPALDLLEPLLEVPFYLSPGWLSIDPLFDPLRDHPRFQALLEEYDTN